jgi:hypothetical protein
MEFCHETILHLNWWVSMGLSLLSSDQITTIVQLNLVDQRKSNLVSQ